MTIRTLVFSSLMLATAACDEPQQQIAEDWDPTGVGWTTELVSRIPEVSREAQLVGLAPVQRVRTSAEDGFDRFVIEIRDRGMPNYHVRYADEPLRECETGEPVRMEGEAVIHVRVEPAIAHDESGRRIFEEMPADTGLAVLQDQRLICDEEGSVEWALGVDYHTPFRVIQLTELNRIVIDVRH